MLRQGLVYVDVFVVEQCFHATNIHLGEVHLKLVAFPRAEVKTQHIVVIRAAKDVIVSGPRRHRLLFVKIADGNGELRQIQFKGGCMGLARETSVAPQLLFYAQPARCSS